MNKTKKEIVTLECLLCNRKFSFYKDELIEEANPYITCGDCVKDEVLEYNEFDNSH